MILRLYRLTARRRDSLAAVWLLCLLATAALATAQAQVPGPALRLWQPRPDISSLDLYYGSGGVAQAPHGPMVFVSEGLAGSNPKFIVRDAAGARWKVKLGVEARPETVAVRLLWAMGYYAREDYFVPRIQVRGLHLKRGAELVRPGGWIVDARLERLPKHLKKIGDWKWRQNPMLGTRQFNGLRVMMALLNNWDLKDDNNAIYHPTESTPGGDIYMVSDVGASFGATHLLLPPDRGKSVLADYRETSRRFITRATPQYVDFKAPGRPSWIYLFAPGDYFSRLGMQWIGRRVPRADVEWIAGLLAQLSPRQVHDAFAAADYTPAAVAGFTQALEQRIGELESLRR